MIFTTGFSYFKKQKTINTPKIVNILILYVSTHA